MIDYLEIAEINPAKRRAEAKRCRNQMALMKQSHDSIFTDKFARAEYESLKSRANLMEMSKAQLISMNDFEQAKNKMLFTKEYNMRRGNLLWAFDLAKQAKTEGNIHSGERREHNLGVARDWIKRNWLLYKAARKTVKGF